MADFSLLAPWNWSGWMQVCLAQLMLAVSMVAFGLFCRRERADLIADQEPRKPSWPLRLFMLPGGLAIVAPELTVWVVIVPLAAAEAPLGAWAVMVPLMFVAYATGRYLPHEQHINAILEGKRPSRKPNP